MNIQTDAIVGNQCDKNEVVEFDYNGNKIKWLSFAERGVGLNRNNALMRATADICVLADDDMIFNDGYLNVVEKAFKDNKTADVIVFNLDEKNIKRFRNTKTRKIGKFNYARYGAVRIAFRLESIMLNGIFFNLLFGGGTRYSCGEDTLFLKSCLNCGLRIVAVPYAIAFLNDDRTSTWYNGLTDKLFFDRGVLYRCLNKKTAKISALYHCFKHRKDYKSYGWFNAYKMMKKGITSV